MSSNAAELELIKTEEVYVNELKVLVDSYVNPLEKYLATIRDRKEDTHIPSSSQGSIFLLEKVMFTERIDIIEYLFANIRAIQSCNSMMLQSMKEPAVTSPPHPFPAVAALMRYVPFIKIYADYAKNFDRSNALLTRLETGDVR